MILRYIKLILNCYLIQIIHLGLRAQVDLFVFGPFGEHNVTLLLDVFYLRNFELEGGELYGLKDLFYCIEGDNSRRDVFGQGKMNNEAGVIFDLKVVKNGGDVISQLHYLRVLRRCQADDMFWGLACKCYELINKDGAGERMLAEVCVETVYQLRMLLVGDSFVDEGKGNVKVTVAPINMVRL